MLRALTVIALATLAPSGLAHGQVRIVGEGRYPPHALVRLKAEGVEDRAAVIWRIYPSKDVHRATNPRGVLEFCGPAGTYVVELLVIRSTEGGLAVEEAATSVTIEACDATAPRPGRPGPEAKPDPTNATGRVRFGTAGCSATVIGPRRRDGRWDVLTAAHCVNAVGQQGTLHLKDGRSFGLRVVVVQRTADIAWCVTEEEAGELPYARLASDSPEPGTAVWHNGYGTDRPGNREDGTVIGRENDQGQLQFLLSVSSGDSGAGIFRADTGELISVVCCTSGAGRKAAMWGASTAVITRTRPTPTEQEDAWVPLPIPLRAAPKGKAEAERLDRVMRADRLDPPDQSGHPDRSN
jgi:hypothetical protein